MNQPEKPEKKEKIERAAKDFSDRFTGVMKELAEEEKCWCGDAFGKCPHKQALDYIAGFPKQSSGIEEIIKEFAEKFGRSESDKRPDTQIANYLRTTLTSFETRIRAEEREKVVYCKKSVEGSGICGMRLDCHLHDWRSNMVALKQLIETEKIEAAAQELTRIADLIEEQKFVITHVQGKTSTEIVEDTKRIEREIGFHAAITTILNLIRGK